MKRLTLILVLLAIPLTLTLAHGALILSLVPEGFQQRPLVISPDGVLAFDVVATIDAGSADSLTSVRYGVRNDGEAGNLGYAIPASAFNYGAQQGQPYGAYGGMSVGTADDASDDGWILARSDAPVPLPVNPWGPNQGVRIGIVQFRGLGLGRTGHPGRERKAAPAGTVRGPAGNLEGIDRKMDFHR